MCLLRKALAEEVESGESSSGDIAKPIAGESAQRFEHYELVKGQDGKPVELGRGGMGVTYKAFDVDLRCPVTLKIISEKYLGDESARLRFLREARAAASIRHPNVASVFHLGRTGENYFYAMELLEGETLESIMKRSGRLDTKLVLEIVAQIAAGLEAVHKQKLVHRDIKPSNIMVSLEGAAVTAKIIDLGLAKAATEPASQTAISTPGGFVGTPEFASPEQFAGVPVDIRSDLYSLGVTLWEMVTGKAPFRGTPAEVMYQHQHAALPIEQLEGVPQPIVVLLKKLLHKDPARRVQNPPELLKIMPTIAQAIEARRRITLRSLGKTSDRAPHGGTREPPAKPGPKKISVARLPVTGSNVFGREEDIAFLDRAWANRDVNVVTIVAWAGVGKSTLVNHWLGRMAADQYRSAELIFGWSFYRQGASSADEFLDAALTWFGDPDPRVGTAWEKGERLARLVAHRRTLLVLDGLEPLQNPPGPQEGRLREPSLQSLLRELAAFNTGLCILTTRLPVADIADREGTSVLRRDLEHLCGEAGAQLLHALGAKGSQTELRMASEEFRGHCLALTLLGSYLTDAFHGDIRRSREVSAHLVHDLRQGDHARKVMESYQSWLGEGPELAILRMLGLFDRPADEQTFGVLLRSPAIPGLTESLTDLSPTEWQTILAKLRRTKLLAQADPYSPGQLDTHPLVREYFGGQLRSRRTEAWRECNRRLFNYYRTLAPELPESFRDMEPLFLAVICGCNGGLFREALHEVYIPRIQRGSASFAAKVLGARGALLSVLAHFFEHGSWGLLAEMGIEGQSLTAEDQLFILMQAGTYLTVTRDFSAPEARICYERVEALSNSLGRPIPHSALIGRWRYSLVTEKLSTTLRIAKRIYSQAQEQNDTALMMGGYALLSVPFYFLGDFEAARQYARRGVEIWRAGGVESQDDEVTELAVGCLFFEALLEWHFGEIASCRPTMMEAITVAKELNNIQALALALWHAGWLAHFERDPAEVERLASDLIELSNRQDFAPFLRRAAVLRGWARSASGETAEGISWIEDGIGNYQATGSILDMPFLVALKAEALHLADRTSDALKAITEAEALVERFENRYWSAELHRLRGIFLATLGAEETQIEASFCAAINTAKKQKSVSLERRADASYSEYRRQKASGSAGRGIRLPLW
jgi:hypothetical protein